MKGPLIVQGDGILLLEVDSSDAAAARDDIARFAELIKAPEHVHTYEISPLSVWNAAASGMTASEMCAALEAWSRYEIHPAVLRRLRELAERFGKVEIHADSDDEILVSPVDAVVRELLTHSSELAPFLGCWDGRAWRVPSLQRGQIKRALAYAGWPAKDLAGFLEGAALDIELLEKTGRGRPFELRPYQQDAINSFLATGEGVVVLPCGAGKTIVGIAVMAHLGMQSLIVVTSVTAAQQWKDELIDKTGLGPDDIGLYTGRSKEIRPVTIATYQVLTHRRRKDAPMPHLELLRRADWGLVIYDEVHVLPAPVFQTTAEIQARRRLGLSATLIREDGLEKDVFALVGPKRYDVPWREIERQGWIASAKCVEVRVPIDMELAMKHAAAQPRHRPKIASANPAKIPCLRRLLNRHRQSPTLIIGTYIEQLEKIAAEIDAPLLIGATSQKRRDTLFSGFRQGEIPVLVVSKVANYAVDLPDASVAIQVSGSFGSRQEEAQRLGRLLRPKPGENQAHFYTLVSEETVEREFADRRHLFLVEQGYEYEIIDSALELEE